MEMTTAIDDSSPHTAAMTVAVRENIVKFSENCVNLPHCGRQVLLLLSMTKLSAHVILSDCNDEFPVTNRLNKYYPIH